MKVSNQSEALVYVDFGDFRQCGRFLGIFRNFGQISDNGSDFHRNFGHLAIMRAIFTENLVNKRQWEGLCCRL